MKYKIYIQNKSTVLKDKDITKLIPALQKQVSTDFKKFWKIDAGLTFVPSLETAQDGMLVIVKDKSNVTGALGYHFSKSGHPITYIFAEDDIRYNGTISITLSHEILEMLADPSANLTASKGNTEYAYEVCDPVESDTYRINGILVSDFVTPEWFEYPPKKAQFDFLGKVTKPFQLSKGGYVQVRVKGVWKTIFKQKKEPQLMHRKRM